MFRPPLRLEADRKIWTSACVQAQHLSYRAKTGPRPDVVTAKPCDLALRSTLRRKSTLGALMIDRSEMDTGEFRMTQPDLAPPEAISSEVRINVAAISDKGHVREKNEDHHF